MLIAAMNGDQLRKALAEVEKAERAGFIASEAVFNLTPENRENETRGLRNQRENDRDRTTERQLPEVRGGAAQSNRPQRRQALSRDHLQDLWRMRLGAGANQQEPEGA